MTENMGKQIRAGRQRSSLTQEKLAEALGVTPQAVSKWERGESLPDIALLPELSAALGLTLDELFESSAETHLRRIQQRMENEPRMSLETFRQAEAQLRQDALETEYRPRCLTLLAELYNHMAEGFRSRAEEAAKEAIDLRPREKDNLDALTWAMGGALADWNFANHSRLIAYWQDYVEKYPDHSPAYLYLLDNLLADGRLTEAEAALTKLAALRQDFQIPCYRGLIEKARGRRAAAWEIWNAMVANDPENWLVYLCRADCHAREADYPAAIADYRQAAERQPKPRYTDPWDSIAQLARLSHDREREAEAYREDYRHPPDRLGPRRVRDRPWLPGKPGPVPEGRGMRQPSRRPQENAAPRPVGTGRCAHPEPSAGAGLRPRLVFRG